MKVLIPKQPRQDYFCHRNDSFREMLVLWKENGLIELEEINNPYIWIKEVGDILLYDRPQYNKKWMLPHVSYRIGLFGNEIPIPSYKKNTNWIFWGRHPRLLEKFSLENVDYNERIIETIFIGNIENEVQGQYRTENWKDYIEFFYLTKGKEQKFNQEEYLEKIQQSRFGLCLRGFGPKCHREMEYMALGVVPIITDNVCLSYFHPLQENVHYIRVSRPEDIPKKVSSIGRTIWEFMSKNCKEYYKKYCSIQGSFDTTKTIIDSVETRLMEKIPTAPITNRIHSFCTFATGKVWKDLKLFLHSYMETHRYIPLYIMTDDEIEEKIKPFESQLKIFKKNCLNEYSGKNRREMEKEGIFKTFTKTKADLIQWTLENEKNTMYTDADIVFLYSLESFIDFSKDVGISPHLIHPENAKKYGYYNSGFLFVQNKNFPKWWKETISHSRFFEQGCLDLVPMHFSFFEFHSSCNFGWWRMFEAELHFAKIQSTFGIQNEKIYCNGNPLTTIHTHFFLDSPNMLSFKFNEFICSLLDKVKSNYTFYTELLEPKDGFIMIQQYYNEKNVSRQEEVDLCLYSNLKSVFVKKLILWNETGTIVPEKFKKNKKLIILENKDWINYQDVIHYTNQYYPNDIILLSNLDIYLEFSHHFMSLFSYLKENKDVVFCSSRIESDKNGKLYFDPKLAQVGYANCQDTWIFRGDVPLKNCSIPLGYLGCENAFAQCIKESNLIPVNVGSYIPLIHVDSCRGKSVENQKEFHGNKVFHSDQSFLVPFMNAVLKESFCMHRRKEYLEKCIELNKQIKIVN